MHRTFIACIVIILISCTPAKNTTILPVNNLVADGKLWSSLYQQKAAEYTAICYQAYNVARLRVDEALQSSTSKPLAIITDIDETVVDNSPYAVHQALQGKDYDKNDWYAWTSKAVAKPLAGSLDFFTYAASKNVTVFYITNRDEQERMATLTNLQKFNFPFADNAHLFLKQDMSSKESRRQTVAANYNIILLLGDNLADFSTLWDKKSTDERESNVTATSAMFGKKFIIFPNANYGGWEDAIYGNKYTLTPGQKDSAINANLMRY